MSGGSMDYLYSKVEDASFTHSSSERKAFAKHLRFVAKALRAIEWNDSGDGDDSEHDAIMACITPSCVIEEAIESAQQAKAELEAVLGCYAAPGQGEKK